MFSGESVKARSVRAATLAAFSFGGSNVLRLASNLVLTRILFPEDFGMMALVQVFIIGLGLFSDIGIKTSIIQSQRGDDPVFLNTAWTIQIVRGVLLWLCAVAIAPVAADLYDAPLLKQLLPVAGLTTIILGFTTTKEATANRHLTLGRVTVIELASQAFGIVVMVALAYMLQSVWALVFGGLIAAFVKMFAQHLALPGLRNRLHWDRESFQDIFRFGKFIFLSTAATFLMTQGDKAILGGFVSLTDLGIYNIGYFLGSIPVLFSSAISGKVVLPLYRIKPVSESLENKKQVFKARRLIIMGGLGLLVVMAYGGIFLVETLYDARYALAGPVIVLMSLALLPRLILSNYGAVLLAAGDSKNFFMINVSTAILQTIFMFAGVMWFGMFGVIIAQAIAILLTHPLRIYQVLKYDGWDPKADAFFLSLGLVLNGFACWLFWDDIQKLIN